MLTVRSDQTGVIGREPRVDLFRPHESKFILRVQSK